MTAAHEILSERQMRAVLAVLERCEDLGDGPSFKEGLVEAIAVEFDVRNVTFFHGPTYSSIFDDPAPLLTGATSPLLRAYQEEWRDKDVFALPQARRVLSERGFATLDELSRLPGPQHSYVVDYLNPNHMDTASAMHLPLADGEALVGLFDKVDQWEPSDVVAVRMLARQLRARTVSVSVADPHVDEIDSLTPRQMEVAALVSEGLSNAEIADRLFLSQMSIKKYMSRIFEATGYRNRSELATAVLRHRRTAPAR